MPQCPICDNTLDQDFGMVTCSECKAVLMIDISGQVQVGSGGEDSTFTDEGLTQTNSEVTNSFISEPTVDTEITDLGEIHNEELTNPVDFDESTNSLDAEILVQDTSFDIDSDVDFEEATPDSSFVPNDTADQDEDAWEDDSSIDNDSPPEESVHGVVASDNLEDFEGDENFSMPESADDRPVDVTQFANSEASSLEGGEYLYDINVSKLDSKDLKENFKFVLMDEKLKIDWADYVKSIKEGKVTISGLNPIKAKRIVEQLQFMDVDVRWTQKRIVMEIDPIEENTDDVDA